MGAQDLSGRTAVITGAGGGIGRALALEAARRDMKLVLIDASAEGVCGTADQARALGVAARDAVIDVRDAAALRSLSAEVDAATLLFANAGLLRSGPLLDQSSEAMQLMLDINIMGVLNTVQAFAPAMTGSGGPAHIVITGSQASFAPFPGLGVYSATKHALLAIADTLRSELSATSPATTVSLLAPGSVATGIYGGAPFPNAALSISPEQVAAATFAGAINGDAIISTHADLRDRIERRLSDFRAALQDEGE